MSEEKSEYGKTLTGQEKICPEDLTGAETYRDPRGRYSTRQWMNYIPKLTSNRQPLRYGDMMHCFSLA